MVTAADAPAPVLNGGRTSRAAGLLDDYLQEAADQRGYPWDVKPQQLASGRTALDAPPDDLASLVVVTARNLLACIGPEFGANGYHLRGLLPALLRKRPAFRDDDILELLAMMTATPATWSSYFPVLPVANGIARWAEAQGVSGGILRELRRLCDAAAGRHLYADERRGLDVLLGLLGGDLDDSPLIDAADDWGAAALEATAALEPGVAAAWQGLLAYAATAEASKPSARWLSGARERIEAFGRDAFARIAADWLLLLRRPASGRSRVGSDAHLVPASLITDRNATLIKGLAWFCGTVEDPALPGALGDAAVACFTKLPDIGARCTKGGNACIHALGIMPGMDAVAQLVRLQQRIAYSQPRRAIDGALDTAAARAGLTRDDLADIAVPSFGLVDGRVHCAVGAFTAEIAVGADGRVAVTWADGEGKPRKSVPAEVKRAHATELQEVKRRSADIETMLSAQRLRIERFLMSDRTWRIAEWRERLLDHPLLSFFARRLIWSFAMADGEVHGCWLDGRLVGSDDAPLTGIDGATVRLFHPVRADAATVRAWQLWLERHRITQPFKQAHREVYALTDAERVTEHYSARFAGHILHQHQFAALCRSRGWSYRLQSGYFDGANTPTLPLPHSGLAAEFTVYPAEDDGPHTMAGIARYVTSDRAAFRRTAAWPPELESLAEIPSALFSEVMRDVDLFVGVAGVGADPAWQGRDGEQYGAYWQGVAFGDLDQTALGRRDVLERLMPALAIAPRCSFADRFLVVRGDLRTYRIHLGSGNVLMEPNNAYLCIVQQPWGKGQRAAERIYLPFEGDATLSLILSKAILLANDRALTDPTILRQIDRE